MMAILRPTARVNGRRDALGNSGQLWAALDRPAVGRAGSTV
jgi:hypothetical protein